MSSSWKIIISMTLRVYRAPISYSSNVYCAHLWANYAQYHLAKLRVCYNNAFRKLFHFDRYSGASMMFVNLLTPSFGKIMRSGIYNFICRLWRCQNKVISIVLCCDCDDIMGEFSFICAT